MDEYCILKMEETALSQSQKYSTSQQDKIKITPQNKINQLHDLIQGYLYNSNSKKMAYIFPEIDRVKSEIFYFENEKHKIEDMRPNDAQMIEYYETRRKLTENIQNLSKEIEATRAATKELRFKRKQLEQQSIKNYQIVTELKTKIDKLIGQENIQSPRLPKLSHRVSQNKRKQSYGSGSRSSVRNSQMSDHPETRNYMNSLSFLRLKQMDKLLDTITVDSATHKFQKLLVGNKKESILKKVLKNYNINEFFDAFVSQKTAKALLLKLQKS